MTRAAQAGGTHVFCVYTLFTFCALMNTVFYAYSSLEFS